FRMKFSKKCRIKLMSRGHLRRRYKYSDAAVAEFCKSIAQLAVLVTEIPNIRAVRDPDDDKILGCAVGCAAEYVVSRDKDLLSIGVYRGKKLVTPEPFVQMLGDTKGGFFYRRRPGLRPRTISPRFVPLRMAPG